MEIRSCTVAELEAAPNLAQLFAEYAQEGGIDELGPANVQVETYRKLEASGMLHPIGAFDGDRLIGFIIPIAVVLPHHGVLAFTVDAFFVPRAERKSGAGLQLLAYAEGFAKSRGAKVLLLSAPVDGVLSRVMSGKGSAYRHSRNMFVRAL